jgi:hypothetical protein
MVRPVMRRPKSTQSRFFATLVAAAIATAPIHVALAAPTFEELYAQGQEKFDQGEYGDAGDLWGQAVRVLPEDKANSATRQTLMNLALDSYLRAYRADDKDRAQIDDAKALLDEYEASLASSGTELSPDIASTKGKIDDILAELQAAEDEAAAAAAATETDKTETEPEPVDDIMPVGNDKPGRGLVIGGAALLGGSSIGIGLLLGGVIGGLKAQTDYNDAAVGSTERTDASKRGNTMNALAITGGVLTPLLIGAGTALLIIGLRKNKAARRNAMLVPNVGPRFVGVGLTGRF